MSRGHPKSVTLTPGISFLRDNIRGVMDLICHNCGKSFKNFPSNIKKNKNTYCSQKCHYEKRSEKNRNDCTSCKKKLDPKRKGFYKDYCKLCYMHKWYEKNPHQYEKRLKKSREKWRKKIGLPLNHPLLIGKKGCGTYSNGYKYFNISNHPNSSKCGKVAEHVMVMSNYIGRPLMKGETVHHLNGIRDDNRIENLELWSKRHPPGQRVKDMIKFCSNYLIEQGFKIIDSRSCVQIFYDDKATIPSS